MSLYDYEISKQLGAGDPPFAAFIMAAYARADSTNTAKIGYLWPEIAAEVDARYNAPGGLLDGETRHG